MRIFEIVKENVNLREAAELYEIENRYGKAGCPFHSGRQEIHKEEDEDDNNTAGVA